MLWMMWLGCAGPAEGLVGLNEVGPTAIDDRSETAPFAEMYNASDEAVSLEGWVIEHGGTTWTIGAVDVPAEGITMLWLDGQPEQGSTHGPIVLDPQGGGIDIFDADGDQVQAVEVPSLQAETSFGRRPDGAANWQVLEDPSPGDLNGE